MKGPFAIAVFAIVCSGCSQPVSPTSPSSVSSGNLRLDAAAGAGSQDTSRSRSARLVPFKGSFAGTQTSTPLEPPFAFVDGSATGNGTHLGRFTLEFPHTVNFATASGEGTFTFTAANGDTVTADFTGQAQVGPTISIVEQATITGGTGRFAGATGSFTAWRVFNPASGATEGSFQGTMSVAGADNP